MKAPLSTKTRSTSSRLAPGSGRKRGSRYSSSPEKYQSKTCIPPCRPSGSATPSSGPATNPSSDIDMSMTTLVIGTSSQARSWAIRSESEYLDPSEDGDSSGGADHRGADQGVRTPYLHLESVLGAISLPAEIVESGS